MKLDIEKLDIEQTISRNLIALIPHAPQIDLSKMMTETGTQVR
jgi:hypothetical protein